MKNYIFVAITIKTFLIVSLLGKSFFTEETAIQTVGENPATYIYYTKIFKRYEFKNW